MPELVRAVPQKDRAASCSLIGGASVCPLRQSKRVGRAVSNGTAAKFIRSTQEGELGVELLQLWRKEKRK
jgi:hypothetical protein